MSVEAQEGARRKNIIIRLPRPLTGYADDPYRRAVNEQCTPADAGGWRLTAALHALLAAKTWRQGGDAGDAAAVALYTAASVATAALIHWRRGVYARHRELLTAAGAALHAWMWLRLVLGGGLGLARLHGASPLRLLGMLAVCNYSLFAFLYFVHGRMPVAAMRLVLPLLALQPLAQGGRLCRCLLAEPGAEQAIADLSHALTAFHTAALMPLPHAPVLQDPQHQCMLVNAWLLAAASVALPLALLWRMERRGRRLLGQPAAPPRRHLPTPLQGAWPSLMCAYLESCLLWCAASIGMFAWLSAQPGGLAQLAW